MFVRDYQVIYVVGVGGKSVKFLQLTLSIMSLTFGSIKI